MSVFISYSSLDEETATKIYHSLKNFNVPVFMAKHSLSAGDKWTKKIIKHLEDAEWIIYIASKNSSISSAVQQELGISIANEKKIISIIVDDMTPEELPGWIKNYQAISLVSEPECIQTILENISKKFKKNKVLDYVILGALAVAFLGSFFRNKKFS